MAVWFYPGQEDYITKLNELGAIAELLSGPDGWSPELAVVPDGERRVFQVADWVGGETTKPPIGDYVGSTGYVSNIADAIDIRGPQGVEGADGVAGPSNVLSIGTVTGGATASATITGTSPSQVLNLVLPKGDPGTNGTDGLAATIAVGTVTTGAAGTSATVVNSGTSSAAVFDFTIPRGDTGSGGGGSGDVVGPASATNNGVALFDGTTGKLIKDGGVLGTAAFEAATSFATAAQGTKADTAVQPGSLATVATSGAYADLTGKPTLGTASTLNVPATGNAATGEVVKGDDTRLSDSRTPTGAAGGVLSGSYPNPGFAVDMATQVELDAVSDVANAKLSDAPSDGKTYGRKDAAWAEVVSGGGSGYATGDVLVTAHTLSTPDYVSPDTVYLQSSYPGLFAIVGTLGDGGATKTKLPNPSTLPAANALDCSWDASGRYLAVVNDSVSPYLIVYERSGSTLTKLSDPATMPVSGYACAWSQDGEFLAVGSAVSPYLHIYQRSGSTLTKITDPSSMPTHRVNGISWSADGKYLALGLQTSPYIAVYERSGTTFTKLADPASLPGSVSSAISCDASGSYIAVASIASPFMAVYERAGSTLTKLSNPATLPVSQGNACAWSPSGEFLAIGHNNSPFVSIYQRVGATLTKLANPASLPAAAIYGCAWDSTGQYLALGTQISPFITVYHRGGTTFTKLANPSTLPTGFGRGVSWAASGGYLAVAHTTTPFVTAYSSFPYDQSTQFRTPSVLPVQQLPVKTYIKA